MCIIVDANASHRLTDNPLSEEAAAVRLWIRDRNGTMAIGGKLRRELAQTRLRRELVVWRRTGRLKSYSDRIVDQEEKVVSETMQCVSNDPHIVALARVSGSRLLYSFDQLLHTDFKNSKLVSGDRGKVYNNIRHKRLLQQASDCN